MKRSLCLALAVLVAGGCAGPQPLTRTPNSGQLATNDLKLGLVVSDKTRDSIKRMHAIGQKYARLAGGMTGASTLNDISNKPFDAFTETLKRDFASVTLVDDVGQAAAAGVDLIAVLDVDVSAKDASFLLGLTAALFTLDLSMMFEKYFNPRCADIVADVTFMAPDQKQVEQLRVEEHGRVGPTTQLMALIADTSDRVGIRLENALAGSTALAAYAKTRVQPQAAPVASAAPAGPKSDVDSPGYSLAQKADDVAVVVGVEKYANIPDAVFAERDAEAMHRHLVALGYPEGNIVTLVGEQATRSSIQKYVEAWLPKNVKPDSEVIFYFSGHGAPDTASKRAYLVPWDGDPKFLENTGYSLSKLYAALGALKARRVVVALDSCFSGAGGRSVIAQGTRPLVTKVDVGAPAGAMTILSASAADEVTGADGPQGHGLFTYYLLEGLNRSKGAASVSEIYAALRPAVHAAARRQNREQSPQLTSGDSVPVYFY